MNAFEGARPVRGPRRRRRRANRLHALPAPQKGAGPRLRRKRANIRIRLKSRSGPNRREWDSDREELGTTGSCRHRAGEKRLRRPL